MNGLQLLVVLIICGVALYVNICHTATLDRNAARQERAERTSRHLWVVPSEPEAPSASPAREVEVFDWEREGMA